MTSARKSTIPGRKHKMVFVDFSNPYLRDYLAGYCEAHRRHLDGIRARLADWVGGAIKREVELSRREDRVPRPLAAVLDIDEVLLSNIHMNVFQATAGSQGPDPIDFHAADFFTAPDGKPWPRDDLRLNPLLPGARELVDEMLDLGLRIYLVTGRLESIRAETVENLVLVGLASDTGDAPFLTSSIAKPGGLLVMCPDDKYPPPGQSIRPFKEQTRRGLEAVYRIVVNVGDQVSDLGLYGDSQVHVPHPFYYTP